MTDPTVFDPHGLSRRDRAALHAHRDALAGAADAGAGLAVRVGDGDVVDLPPALARVVAAALAEVADGHAVEVRTVAEELTTQEAADLLGVSRPFVVKLVDSGELPGRLVGTHRRIRRGDALAYRERTRATTTDALQELSDEAQELGLFDAEQRMPGADGPPPVGSPTGAPAESPAAGPKA